MYRIPFLLIAALAFQLGATGQFVDKVTDPVDFVNPLMGTQSTGGLSSGNTYPSIAMPWGMNFWTPQTGKMGDGWQYTYTAEKIKGFKQTHQPSPWMNDYGEFSIMPITGALRYTEDSRASWFSHKAEVVKPYYYSVYLADHDITTEITPTERAAQFRFTFPRTDSTYIVVDAYDKGSYIKVIPGENKVVGYSTRNSGGVPSNFRNYFVIVFDKPFASIHTWKEKDLTDALEQTSKHSGAVVGFGAVQRGTVVHARVASSFISIDQAEENLKEIGNDSFETTAQKGRDIWNKTLGRVEVEGGTIDQMRTFYSCLYRMLFFPLKLYEKDKSGKIVHYSVYNGKVEDGYLFAGTGFWDTFRALYPFLNLVYPSINKEMQQGLVSDYKEGGWLPEWSSPGYRSVMVGNNSASVVADAWQKGIRGYDINLLYEALKKDANNMGPIEAVGRTGVEYYNTLGYVPYDVKINENAARTLEYAFDDFSIYRLAKALGRPASELKLYAGRAMNYKNLFDPEHKLMRGKNKDGKFQSPFNPFKWGDAFTEGNSWHYSWSVFHDIQGLIDLMGGKPEFIKMLDSIFIMPPTFDDSYYGGVIHEIREMQIAGMGQYAHGNQPIQHMLYLYNYAGEPWKTQYWVRQAMSRLYQATADGYCGDEDNGQTSAWYVFSALGFYSVCPGTDQYVLGTPLFKKATIHLENGKDFVISAPANSATNLYVQSATLQGQPYEKNWISHSDIQQGGEFQLTMGETPNKTKGTDESAYPYSFSTDNDNPLHPAHHDLSVDTIRKSKYTLIFINKDPSFSPETRQQMIDAFFTVYPREAKRFNKNTLRTVTFFVDPTYKGVAETDNGRARYNPEWLKKNPEDIDVVTHEVMHIVQDYRHANPGWLTEGIADYVRYEYGVNNVKSRWTLPDYRSTQNFDNAYRVTARFLLWVEKTKNKKIVDRLDAALRDGTYQPELWATLTGSSVEQLWKEYAAAPALSLTYN